MKSLEELRQIGAERRAAEGLGQTLPPPTMTLAEIASKLYDLWSEVQTASISGATLADGVAWTKLQGDLATKEQNLLELAIQVAEQNQQVQAVNTWVTQAQASMTSMQNELTACRQAEASPHLTTPVSAAIAVGTALLGGIVGFMGGRVSAGGKAWPWTQ